MGASAVCMREAIWAVTVALHCVGSLDLKQRASSAASGATILLTADTHRHKHRHKHTHTRTHTDEDMCLKQSCQISPPSAIRIKQVTALKEECRDELETTLVGSFIGCLTPSLWGIAVLRGAMRPGGRTHPHTNAVNTQKFIHLDLAKVTDARVFGGTRCRA